MSLCQVPVQRRCRESPEARSAPLGLVCEYGDQHHDDGSDGPDEREATQEAYGGNQESDRHNGDGPHRDFTYGFVGRAHGHHESLLPHRLQNTLLAGLEVPQLAQTFVPAAVAGACGRGAEAGADTVVIDAPQLAQKASPGVLAAPQERQKTEA